MSNMFSSRKTPLLLAGGLLAGIFMMTHGANQQPRPRAMHHPGSTQLPVSETLQSAAGLGGRRAAHYEGESPVDTRLYSADPSAPSKRDATKAKGEV